MVSRSRCCAASIRLLLALLTYTALLESGEADAAQLTASWVDNSSGAATTRVERRLGADIAFTAIADVPAGVTTYLDASVSSGTTYCYRALAYDAAGVSPYSEEACAIAANDVKVTVAKAGTGTGTVVSAPAGINCGAACSATLIAGNPLTLSATPASGSTFSGWNGSCAGTGSCTIVGNAPITVTATFTAIVTNTGAPSSLPPATFSVIYNGKARDRVGQGNTALAADGALDGTLTATLSASGGRTITALKLQSTGPGIWDTDASGVFWVLGVATALDAPLINSPATMAVNLAVPDGGTFVLFASDYAGIEFVPGATLT